MNMMELFAILLVFASVFFVVLGLRAHPVDPVETRLRAVQSGMRSQNRMLAQPFIRRAAAPMASGLVRLIMKFLPHTWIKETERKLVWGGGSLTLPGFVLIWTALTALFAAMSFVFASSLGLGIVGMLVAAAVGTGIGGFLPQLWLGARVSERQFRTRKSLPDALDLMTTSVEAGLSLDAAMIRVAEFQRAPFQDELARAMQEMALGKSRREALAEICDRLNSPEVITFIHTVNQAEVTGAPIGQVLRAQADQVRVKRRQAAEAQANRAPILMIIPLVFFILPSMYVVLLAPAALTLIDLLTNSEVFNR